MTFEFFISRRYFKSKPDQTIIALITLLSIIGVAIGVMALIVVIAVMGGFESDLRERILGIEPHLVIDKNGAPITDYENVAQLCRQSSHVQAAWPAVNLQVMLKSESRVAGAKIKGVDPLAAAKGLHIDSLKKLDLASNKTWDADNSAAPIVLGHDLAQSLQVFEGDTVFIISPRGALAPVGFVPFMKRFKVVDFFQTGMYQYDVSLAFMNLSDAQSLAHLKSAASSVEMRVDDIFLAKTLGQELVSQLDSSYRYQDWINLNKNLFAALKLERTAMFITLTLIILVATFSIISSLVMLVIEKTKDIAIFKTMGATRRSIQKLFIYQGMFIGLIGTGAGVIIGTLLCYLQEKYHLVKMSPDTYYNNALPVALRLSDVLIVAVSALFICFLATLYPARQAAQLNPVEAIRYG